MTTKNAERRQTQNTGVHRVTYENGNGDKITTYTATWKRWQAILGSVVALTAIGAFLWTVLAFGFATGVHREIDQSLEPGAPIAVHVDTCIERAVGELEDELEAETEELKEELGTNRGEIGKVQTRQEDIVRQLGRLEDNILTEIRARHSDGGG